MIRWEIIMVFITGRKYTIEWTLRMQCGLTLLIGQLIFCGTVFSQQVSSQQSDSLWKKNGNAEIEYFYNSYGFITAITNYSFIRGTPNRVDLRRAGRRPEIVIGQAIRNEYGPYEGSIGTITAEAFLLVQGRLDKPLWKISKEAHGGDIKYIDSGWRFYQIYYGRGSDGGTLRTLFNLYNGQEILQRTSNLLSAIIPNTMQIRLIGYKRPGPVRNGFIGTLHYASSDSILHELNFYLKNPVIGNLPDLIYLGDELEFIDARNPKNRSNTDERLYLQTSSGSYDPKSFTGFSIKLSYYRDVEVKIPIKNDDFDLSNFTSDLYRIERIK